MKSKTSEEREKQPATRGVVLEVEGAKPKLEKSAPLTERITARFTAREAAELRDLGETAGMHVSEYIRRCVTRPAGVSPDTALVLAEVGRTRELLTRLWSVSVGPDDMDAQRVFDIAAGVEAIDSRVFVARATKNNK